MNIKNISTKDLVNEFVRRCHEAALESGWWHDLKTGELLPNDLNMFAQKTLLVHTEISEATEGFRRNKKDDKLPHRDMVEVEFGDGMIRMGDLAGKFGWDLGGAIEEKMAYNKNRADHKPENRIKADGKTF